VRYLGARTYWVVVFGAITLAVCALAYAVSVLVSKRQGPSLAGREAGGLGILLLPVLAVLLVPSGTLGADAAVSKSSQRAPALSRAQKAPEARARLPKDAIEAFVELSYYSTQPGAAASSGIKVGQAARTVGFVAHLGETPAGHFELTRFAVSCCVADAVPMFVRVDHRAAGEHYLDDMWVEVTGTLVVGPDDTFLLRASDVHAVPVPQQPYVSAF
jgi:putative membrane protein